jgi:hypothetical protein
VQLLASIKLSTKGKNGGCFGNFLVLCFGNVAIEFVFMAIQLLEDQCDEGSVKEREVTST